MIAYRFAKAKKRFAKEFKAFINRFGYELNEVRPVDAENGFEIYRYYKPDGTFDYNKYKEIQAAGNRKKIDNVWVKEENISFLANYIRQVVGNVEFGLCHGARRGKEQEWFRKFLDCEVIGTEISDTAEQFPYTIQWDFHEVKSEWLNAVDFIYSNSFDHSYDPEKCINSWMRCVKKKGLCILEHTSSHEQASLLDPFGAHLSLMPYLILSWGAGKFCVREILDAPSNQESVSYTKFLVIQRY